MLRSTIHLPPVEEGEFLLYFVKYNLNAILADLVYARILSPASKLASYEYCLSLLELPKTFERIYA